ncbi:MAG: hypothetical protein NTU53_01985 [Planctomycetota bacterium]|nr:hypothetical protein [Planctomycetota bacterium]
MIPAFNESGYLPPGIHVATIEEVIARFGGGSEIRRAQGQSLMWLVPVCRAAGIVRLVINGSFVTSRSEPNDVDCLLLQGPDYRRDSAQAVELRQGLPFLEIKIVAQEDFDFFCDTIVATDRDMIAEGLVEVSL